MVFNTNPVAGIIILFLIAAAYYYFKIRKNKTNNRILGRLGSRNSLMPTTQEDPFHIFYLYKMLSDLDREDDILEEDNNNAAIKAEYDTIMELFD